ncbi:peptidyl-tRNA hydrolase Pth2 [Halobacterium sp. R2-5]|uniref:peptidyl-tRNA hydrolase Pth2 n=1 Tax=Halobacterium sp. R2-5 TaxID=2715751 RepID=UPI001420FB7C|nr:peptidyl-tRNA hydrolase Pth2 [Halobacterium sp. R2-5]NIB98634.1 peptidyl-tRNA hydrolase [Halobacterium sp. R2-5]
MKQVIAARTDIGMGQGKLAAQVAHASLKAYEYADEQAQRQWKQQGQAKVVVKAGSERELYQISEEAKAKGLPSAVIEDAGRTQLEPGTPTAVAVGPAADADVDEITGDLSLF